MAEFRYITQYSAFHCSVKYVQCVLLVEQEGNMYKCAYTCMLVPHDKSIKENLFLFLLFQIYIYIYQMHAQMYIMNVLLWKGQNDDEK